MVVVAFQYLPDGNPTVPRPGACLVQQHIDDIELPVYPKTFPTIRNQVGVREACKSSLFGIFLYHCYPFCILSLTKVRFPRGSYSTLTETVLKIYILYIFTINILYSLLIVNIYFHKWLLGYECDTVLTT